MKPFGGHWSLLPRPSVGYQNVSALSAPSDLRDAQCFTSSLGSESASASLYMEGDYIIFFLTWTALKVNRVPIPKTKWISSYPRQKTKLGLSKANWNLQSTYIWFLFHPGLSSRGPASCVLTSPWAKTVPLASFSSQASDLVPRAGWGADTRLCSPSFTGLAPAAYINFHVSGPSAPRHAQANIPKVNLKVRYNKVISPDAAQ